MIRPSYNVNRKEGALTERHSQFSQTFISYLMMTFPTPGVLGRGATVHLVDVLFRKWEFTGKAMDDEGKKEVNCQLGEMVVHFPISLELCRGEVCSGEHSISV